MSTKFKLPGLLMIALAIFAGLTGCAQIPSSEILERPMTSEKPDSLVELQNGQSYDLVIDEIEQEIDGKNYQMLAYNGLIPGPIIKIPQGAEITVNLVNNTKIPTSLHSHGVRVDNAFDGVVDILQKPVGPGESFSYKLKFSDPGMYWYHPHLNEVFTQSHGLYGNFWVIPQDKDYWATVNEEIPLMLSDLSIEDGKTGQYQQVSSHALMGKYGNVMLVNGQQLWNKKFQRGEVVRFYITNAANTRVFNLTIPQAKLKLVGGDNGRYQRETWQQSIILSPSERAIIEVLWEKPGIYFLQNTNTENTYNLARFEVEEDEVNPSWADQFSILRENPEWTEQMKLIEPFFDKKPDQKIRFDLSMAMMGNMSMMGRSNNTEQDHSMMGHGMMNDMMMGADQQNDDIIEKGVNNSDLINKIEWEDNLSMMNSMSSTSNTKWKIIDELTGKENMDINWKFKQGDLVKVEVFNDPKSAHPMQHPLHFHGQRMLILSTNGVRNDNLVWKDTVLVPKGDRMELLVEMSNPGQWMAHCHISEHLESGMMLQFSVEKS